MDLSGICPVCQTKQVVTPSATPLNELLTLGCDREEIDREFGDTICYILAKLESFGEHCGGSGQVPQAVVAN